MIFHGNSYIEAKYRQSTGLPCNGFAMKFRYGISLCIPGFREVALH